MFSCVLFLSVFLAVERLNISGCPTDRTIAVKKGSDWSIPVTWIEPVAHSRVSSDGSHFEMKNSSSHHPGEEFRVGETTTVQYSFWTHTESIQATCDFDINIIEGNYVT